MTSMYIHILPAVVMFSQRWHDHISKKEFPLFEEMDETIVSTLVDFWWHPFVYYAIWQAIYLIKTEIVSKKKLEYNTSIMTSLRWMVRKKTSASYKLLSRFGEHNQLPTFVCIQAVYTLATFFLCPLLWWVHSLARSNLSFSSDLECQCSFFYHCLQVFYLASFNVSVRNFHYCIGKRSVLLFPCLREAIHERNWKTSGERRELRWCYVVKEPVRQNCIEKVQ